MTLSINNLPLGKCKCGNSYYLAAWQKDKENKFTGFIIPADRGKCFRCIDKKRKDK